MSVQMEEAAATMARGWLSEKVNSNREAVRRADIGPLCGVNTVGCPHLHFPINTREPTRCAAFVDNGFAIMKSKHPLHRA
jgi:hypothetical protein